MFVTTATATIQIPLLVISISAEIKTFFRICRETASKQAIKSSHRRQAKLC